MKRNVGFFRALLTVFGLACSSLMPSLQGQLPASQSTATVNQPMMNGMPDITALMSSLGGGDLSSLLGEQNLSPEEAEAFKKKEEEARKQQEELDKIKNPARLPSDIQQDVKQTMDQCEELVKKIDTTTFYLPLCKDIFNNLKDTTLFPDQVPYIKELKKQIAGLYQDLSSGLILSLAFGNGGQGQRLSFNPETLCIRLHECKVDIVCKTGGQYEMLAKNIETLLEFITIMEKSDGEKLGNITLKRIQPLHETVKTSVASTVTKLAEWKIKLTNPSKQEDIESLQTICFYEGELKANLNTFETFANLHKNHLDLTPFLIGIGALFKVCDVFLTMKHMDREKNDPNIPKGLDKAFSGLKNLLSFQNPIAGMYHDFNIGSSTWKHLLWIFLPLYTLVVPPFKAVTKYVRSSEGQYSLLFRTAFTVPYFLQQQGKATQKNILTCISGQNSAKNFINPYNSLQSILPACLQSFQMFMAFPGDYEFTISKLKLIGLKATALVTMQLIKGDMANLWPSNKTGMKHLGTQFVSCIGKSIFDFGADRMIKNNMPKKLLSFCNNYTLGLLDYKSFKNLLWELMEPGIWLAVFNAEKGVTALTESNPFKYFITDDKDNVLVNKVKTIAGIPYKLANVDEKFIFEELDNDLIASYEKSNPLDNSSLKNILLKKRTQKYDNYRYFVLKKIVDYSVKQISKSCGRFAAPYAFKGAGYFINGLRTATRSIYAHFNKGKTVQPNADVAINQESIFSDFASFIKNPSEVIDNTVPEIVQAIFSPMSPTRMFIIPTFKSIGFLSTEDNDDASINNQILSWFFYFINNQFEFIPDSEAETISTNYALNQNKNPDKATDLLQADLINAIKNNFAGWIGSQIAEKLIAPALSEIIFNKLLENENVRTFVEVKK